MLSIVIPLYNKESQIAQTLQSVMNQTYQNFEIVIVDDGSTDNSVSEIEKVTDSRIRLIHQKNAGVSAARNRGIQEARGEFIAFLDADDKWKTNYLEIQNDLIGKYPTCNVFACNYEFLNADGSVTSTILNGIQFQGDGILDNYFQVASISHPPLWTSAVVVRRDSLLQIGGFPVGIHSGEDLLTWARLAVRGGIAFTKKIAAVYCLNENYVLTNLPPRKQDLNDPVGKGLEELRRTYPTVAGIRNYISHWHKMRASVAIRYGMKSETLQEVFYSLKFNIFNYRVIPFAILALLPTCMRRYIIALHK